MFSASTFLLDSFTSIHQEPRWAPFKECLIVCTFPNRVQKKNLPILMVGTLMEQHLLIRERSWRKETYHGLRKEREVGKKKVINKIDSLRLVRVSKTLMSSNVPLQDSLISVKAYRVKKINNPIG